MPTGSGYAIRLQRHCAIVPRSPEFGVICWVGKHRTATSDPVGSVCRGHAAAEKVSGTDPPGDLLGCRLTDTRGLSMETRAHLVGDKRAGESAQSAQL